ncbi:MAG: hypothetical protein ACFFCQ_15170 [Promethearchaeota archaeon]
MNFLERLSTLFLDLKLPKEIIFMIFRMKVTLSALEEVEKLEGVIGYIFYHHNQ